MKTYGSGGMEAGSNIFLKVHVSLQYVVFVGDLMISIRPYPSFFHIFLPFLEGIAKDKHWRGEPVLIEQIFNQIYACLIIGLDFSFPVGLKPNHICDYSHFSFKSIDNPSKLFEPSPGHGGAGQLDDLHAFWFEFFDILFVIDGVVVDPQDDVFAEIQRCGHLCQMHMCNILLSYYLLYDEI